jgi:apolipoprotein N-acyltransferase
MSEPKSRTRRVLEGLGSGLMSIAFVCWIVNGAAGGGHFLGWVLGLFLLPIVLYLLFLLAVGTSFVREARRNVREGRRRRGER